MYAIIQPFLEIALFRKAPQDLPESRLLLGIALGAHAVLGMALYAMRKDPLTALIAGATGTLLLVTLTLSLLLINGLAQRTVRTLTALTGIEVVIGVVGLPVTAWLNAATGSSPIDGIAVLAFVVLLLWDLAVFGHVLRHALSAPLPMGVVLALIILVLWVMIMKSLFPDAA